MTRPLRSDPIRPEVWARMSWHARMRYVSLHTPRPVDSIEDQEADARAAKRAKNLRDRRPCPDCGAFINRSSKRCKSCAARVRLAERRAAA